LGGELKWRSAKGKKAEQVTVDTDQFVVIAGNQPSGGH